MSRGQVQHGRQASGAAGVMKKPADVSSIAVLLLVSGIFSCMWSFGVFLLTCGLWMPGYLFGAGAGINAIIKGMELNKADCSHVKFSAVQTAAILQIIQVINLDFISGGMGVASLILLNNPDVRAYLNGGPGAPAVAQSSVQVSQEEEDLLTDLDDPWRELDQFEARLSEPVRPQRFDSNYEPAFSAPAVAASPVPATPEWEQPWRQPAQVRSESARRRPTMQEQPNPWSPPQPSSEAYHVAGWSDSSNASPQQAAGSPPGVGSSDWTYESAQGRSDHFGATSPAAQPGPSPLAWEHPEPGRGVSEARQNVEASEVVVTQTSGGDPSPWE